MTSEFRRAKRRKMDERVEVTDAMTDRVVGHVGDLSESGLLLIANQAMTSDALYQFRFRLTDGNRHERLMEVGAHELWSDPAAAPGQVWTGFRFIDLAPTDLLFIRQWVAAPGSELVP